MSYRDSEFREMLQAFKISSSLDVKDHVPEKQVCDCEAFNVGRVFLKGCFANHAQRLRIGIIQ